MVLDFHSQAGRGVVPRNRAGAALWRKTRSFARKLAALLRLATAVLMETDEEWQSEKRYLPQVTPSTAF